MDIGLVAVVFFFAFLWTEIKSKSIKTQKIRGQYPAVLAKQAWPVKDYIRKTELFLAGSPREIPRLRSLVANQNGGFSPSFGSWI